MFSCLKEIAVGENEPVSFRQQDASILDGIQATDVLDFLAIDQVAKLVFLIGSHFEQDEIADDGIEHFGIVKRLIWIVDRFGVDPFT